MANKMILKKKYGSPALANLTRRPMLVKAPTVRLVVKKPQQVRIATTTKALPTYRGSFNHGSPKKK